MKLDNSEVIYFVNNKNFVKLKFKNNQYWIEYYPDFKYFAFFPYIVVVIPLRPTMTLPFPLPIENSGPNPWPFQLPPNYFLWKRLGKD